MWNAKKLEMMFKSEKNTIITKAILHKDRATDFIRIKRIAPLSILRTV